MLKYCRTNCRSLRNIFDRRGHMSRLEPRHPASKMPKFVPRQRKHRVLARQRAASGAPADAIDSNADVLPQAKSEQDRKRQQLREQLRAQQLTPRVSGKKQKRLDKYIENKLKKDENLELLRKLEEEHKKRQEQDSSQPLRSSKDLAIGKRRWDQYVEGQVEPPRKPDVVAEEDDDVSEDDFEAEHKEAFQEPAEGGEGNAQVEKARHTLLTQGSGLAQPLALGEDGLPIIQTRPGKKKKKNQKVDFILDLREPADEEVEEESADGELPWEGFSGDEEDTQSSEVQSDSADEELSASDTESTEDEEDAGKEDGSDTSETSELSEDADHKPRPRTSAFKSWATGQLNKSLGHTPSYVEGEGSLPVHTKPVNPPPTQRTAPGEQSITPSIPKLTEGVRYVPGLNRKAYAVPVARPHHIQQSREQLPILQKEQEIMEAIHNNPVIILKGDTGSGKTTQVPQFLYEAGYGSPDGPTPGMIGITQPRRVAAVSMANRVREELGTYGEKISYQIRFDSNVSSKTAVKFMTDGILLRELSQDLLLRKYSVVVIDEAHERSVNTDILIGMLSKIVPARMKKQQGYDNPTPLKLIIMSATLNIGDFVNDRLFPPGSKPPIVEAEGRQHRVTTHFALRSRSDYVEEAVEKVRRAHRKLPQGGILVFLTGQNEIKLVGDQLRKSLRTSSSNPGTTNTKVHLAASETPMEAEDMDFGMYNKFDDEEAAVDDFEVDILTDSEADDKEFEISDDEDAETDNSSLAQTQGNVVSRKDPYTSVHVLPLYSQLPTKEQLRVFDPPPPGARLIVLATNVAETSLTIPGIRYVFDTGRSKERKYNLDTGVQSFEIDYISKASAQQRTGRAGRTGPGHCWRLYSSAVYEQFFPDHAEPEILRAPAENVVLQLKGFSYPLPVTKFPFPTQPSAQILDKAEKLLRNLGALSPKSTVTDLGKELSIYPLSPRLGKILSVAVKDASVLPYLITLVAGLAVSDLFMQESQLDMTAQGRQEGETYSHEDQAQDDERDRRRQQYGRARATLSRYDKTSDAAKLLVAVSMYAEAEDKEQCCRDYFLRPKAMSEVLQLQRQLTSIVQANHIGEMDVNKSRPSSKLSSKQIKQINNIVAAGYIDQVAIRADLVPNPPEMATKLKRAIDVPYLPLVPLTDRTSASLVEKAIFVHPSSLLSRLAAKDLPMYVVYSHLQQSQAATIGGGSVPKTRMFPLTPIDGAHLVTLARDTALIEYGKPVAKTQIEILTGTPKRRECWLSTELRGGSGFGWPMPPTKVRQVMDIKDSSGWRVEEVLS